ncbi:TRAP transporter small permease [Alkalihalobacillus sp. TS-13]|uniref:TRAP transporter small permease n=1 Tax=Alkalihalobacillus sp. TS-13 TaxID=2842455 RepID=UPI001C869599|nr:TRAP transporter small permease [Alkalihalobacillus sp. TS-13]
MEDKQTVPLEQEVPRTIHEPTMMNTEKASVFFRIIDRLNQGSAVLAGTTLLMMILLVVFNSIKRLFSDPIAGTVELVSWLGAVTTIFSLGYAQLHKGHVFIDLLYKKFPKAVQQLLHTFMNLVSIAFFSIAGWQIALYGINLMENGVVSPTMRVSFYPIVIFCSLGFLGLLLALIKETIIIWKGGS